MVIQDLRQDEELKGQLKEAGLEGLIDLCEDLQEMENEQEDIVDYRKTFLCQMVAQGFLNKSNPPTEAAKKALPNDLDPPSKR